MTTYHCLIHIFSVYFSSTMKLEELYPGEDYVLYNGKYTTHYGLLVVVSNTTEVGRLVCTSEVTQFDYFTSYICHQLGFGSEIVSHHLSWAKKSFRYTKYLIGPMEPSEYRKINLKAR